jgi:hypothetical protein
MNITSDTMQLIPNRLRKSFAIRGYIGTFKLLGNKTIDLSKRLTPSFRAARQRERDSDREFDSIYGVETCGIDRPGEAAVQGNNWVYGNRYQAVNPMRFNQLIRELPIPYEEFVFVDFGSGKGRAVLLAAGFPFKGVVGIEYADDLHRVAMQNVVRYPNASKICKEIDLVCMDASEYCLPHVPLVLFFNNPFGRAVMEKTIENVRKSFEQTRTRMVVIYLTALYADLWDELPFLKRIRPDRNVWDTGAVPVTPE